MKLQLVTLKIKKVKKIFKTKMQESQLLKCLIILKIMVVITLRMMGRLFIEKPLRIDLENAKKN